MMIKKYFMKSVSRITKDFKHKELLPLKLVFFVQASTISVLYPYLTIHMRELGISVEEVAIMSAVIPVIGMIMPPLAGMVADKIGNFKLLLAFFSFIGGAAALLLLLVPVGRITVTYPERVTFNMGCKGIPEDIDLNKGYFQLGAVKGIPCKLNNSVPTPFDLDAKLEACGFACRPDPASLESLSNVLPNETDSETPSKLILRATQYKLENEDGILLQRRMQDVPKIQMEVDTFSHRTIPNDQNLQTYIRKISFSEYFIPIMDWNSLNFTCYMSPSNGKERQVFCSIGELRNGFQEQVITMNKTIRFSLSRDKVDELNEFGSLKSQFVNFFNSSRSGMSNVTCGTKKNGTVTAQVDFLHPKNDVRQPSLNLSQCEPRCLISTMRKSICTNLEKVVIKDPQLTFWVYLTVRVFIGIIGSTSYAMYEVAVIAILREHKADYGLQRIYASIGGMISSPLSGILIDWASQGKGYTDFRPAFYLYGGLKLGTSFLMLFINLEFKKAASNVIKDAKEVLKNVEIIALLYSCFVLGTAWGYIESFLFWFLQDLGGTRSLMGITITVGGIAGIPLLVLSGPIIDKIGHANVIFIGFLFYGIRLVGYSLIYNPYHCLFFEAMESITSSLALTACITYAAKLSTTTTDGSVQGLVGGLYFGIGRGAGSLVGGYLMKAFGTRPTYQIFAVFTFFTAVLYFLFNKFYINKRPRQEGNEICKKEPKPKKNTEMDLNIITEKPKDGNKGNGIVQSDDNNSVRDGEKVGCDNDGFVGSKDEKKEEDDKETEKESHSNPGYVPEETNTEKDTNKKED